MDIALHRSAFIFELKRQHGGIDVNKLSPELRQALAETGIGAGKLEKIAGKDGVIRGTRELEMLFAAVDSVDHNGWSSSVRLQAKNEAGVLELTAPGKLYSALRHDAQLHRERQPLSSRDFVGDLERSNGTIDTENLSPRLQAALKEAGIDTAKLKQVAGPDGLIRGRAELGKLFALINTIDGDASDTTLAVRDLDPESSTHDATTKSGHLYHAIRDEVEANRDVARYQRTGYARAARQDGLTVAGNALVAPEADRAKAVDLDVEGINQFDLFPNDPVKGGTACYAAAVRQTTLHNGKKFGNKAPRLNGPSDAIQIGIREDSSGRLEVDADRARLGREYIDRCLDRGYPILLGVSYADHSYNHDRLTDHFVTVYSRGYDAQGRLYYDFKDPGDGGRSGRFYVGAKTGKLFREGDHKTGYVRSADYEVSHIRTYAGVE